MFSKMFLKIKLLIMLAVIINSCTAFNSYATSFEEQALPEYKVEKKACDKPFKCSYDLRIESKLSENELTEIANKLFAESPRVNKIFIMFYLPCMKVGSGAWASAIFDPKLQISTMDFMLTANPTCAN